MEKSVKKQINDEVRKVTNMMKGSALEDDTKNKFDQEEME